MWVLVEGEEDVMHEKFKRAASWMLTAAMLVSNGGVIHALAEATPTEAAREVQLEPAVGHEDAVSGMKKEQTLFTANDESDVSTKQTDGLERNAPAEDEGGEDETCEHVFKEGVCELCGYVCPHENKIYGDEVEGSFSNWIYFGDENHMRTVNVYQTWTCADCGEKDQILVAADQQRFEAHDFVPYDDLSYICTACDGRHYHDYSNGPSCSTCGYACPHTNRTTNIVSGDDEDSYVSIDDKEHQYDYITYEVWQCAACLQIGRGAVLNVQTEKVNHQYDENGLCKICGHQNACQHENSYEQREIRQTSDWKDDGNGRTHSCEATEYLNWYCDDCRQSKSTEIGKTTKTAVHHTDGMNDDVCGVCYAPIECPHSQLSDVSEYVTCSDWKDDGNGQTHSGLGTRRRGGWCTRCGVYVIKVLEENVPVTEEHRSYDGTTCAQCGAAIACSHDKTYERILYQGDQTAKDNGDGTHTVYQDMYKETVCETCGYQKYEKMDETATRVEKHPYLTCPNCGAEAKANCEHAHTQIASRTVSEDMKPDANGKTHSGTQTIWIQEYCQDCLELVRTVQKMTADVCEPHEIDKQLGYCRVCGYIVPDEALCRHEQTYTEYEEYRTDVAQNEKEHSYRSALRKVTYCKQCGVVLTDEDAAKSDLITEAHEFDGTGLCWCGYRRNNQQTLCKHEHKRSWTAARQTVKFVNVDDTQHTVEQILVDYTYCDDCDEMLEAGNMRRETVTEKHAYLLPKVGECYICGHVNACRHPNTVTSTEYVSMTHIRAINDRQHSYTAYGELETAYCPDCETVVSEKLVDSTVKQITEAHWPDEDGTTCLLCGAAIAAEKPTDQPTEAPTPEPTAQPSEDTSSSSGGSSNRGNSSNSGDTDFVPTPEPTAAPVAEASEEMHKTFNTLDEIEREIQQTANVEIEIVGMEEIMPEETAVRVQQLSVKEQLLMTLTAADCGSVAQSIVDSMNLTLTENAKTLFGELNATPVEEQKVSEVRQRLTELFPVHVIVRDNVYYHVHVMTVNITVDGVKTTYYFGLRLDEFGLWQMVELTSDEASENTLLKK